MAARYPTTFLHQLLFSQKFGLKISINIAAPSPIFISEVKLAMFEGMEIDGRKLRRYRHNFRG